MAQRKINFIGIQEMIEYAKEVYPNFRDYVENGDISGTAETNIYRQIHRTLERYKLVSKQDNEKKNQKIEVAEEIAHYIIEYILTETFLSFNSESNGKIEEKHRQKKEEQRKKVMEQVKKISAKKDELLNKKQQQLMGEPHSAEIDEEFIWQSELEDGCTLADECWESEPYIYDNPPDLSDDAFEGYHIPKIPLENCPPDFADQVIDRIMIRTIFHQFYTFNEQDFRHDLKERASLIDVSTSSSTVFLQGYSELTNKLENPLGNYIFPKQKGKSSK